MNEESKTEPPPDAESIVQLRGEGPRVVRLSRKAIGIASAAGLTVLGGILLYALQPPSQDGGEELVNTEGIAVADGLATAPADYSQVPRSSFFSILYVQSEDIKLIQFLAFPGSQVMKSLPFPICSVSQVIKHVLFPMFPCFISNMFSFQ